eukprot:11744804-Karenia_brevis.AAC.1
MHHQKEAAGLSRKANSRRIARIAPAPKTFRNRLLHNGTMCEFWCNTPHHPEVWVIIAPGAPFIDPGMPTCGVSTS